MFKFYFRIFRQSNHYSERRRVLPILFTLNININLLIGANTSPAKARASADFG